MSQSIWKHAAPEVMLIPHAAIVGVGESRVGRVPDQSTLQLQASAARAAIADAGLSLSDIDGVLTTPVRVEHWQAPGGILSHHLGIRPDYFGAVDMAGASGAAMIDQAAMAVSSGRCKNVLCIAGQNLLSHNTRFQAVKSMAENGSAHPQFEVPYGPLVPSLYALVAQRHMHEYGTTSEQLAEVAVAIRSHAHLNENAHMRDLISIGDVTDSRIISSPLHLLDCAVVSDGAVAAVVTSGERAKDRVRPPVYLLGAGYGVRHSYVGSHNDITTTGAVDSGRLAFERCGLRPVDIDVAELYDCFTITVIIELEDLGFCPKGEGGRFVAGGRIRLGGDLPVTTHGGLLSAGHPGVGGGLFHVIEAVRQLRGEAGARQVKNAQIALAHGNGGVMSVHCTLVLGGPGSDDL